MSYGLNFLAIDREKPTIALSESTVELEGIGTNYLPALTDLVKIRWKCVKKLTCHFIHSFPCRKMYAGPKKIKSCYGGNSGIGDNNRPINEQVCLQEKRGFKLRKTLEDHVQVCIRALPWVNLQIPVTGSVNSLFWNLMGIIQGVH